MTKYVNYKMNKEITCYRAKENKAARYPMISVNNRK